MAKARLVVLFLLPILAGVATAEEMDPYGMRQTAGVYLTVDRNVRTIYLDFSSVRAKPTTAVTVPVTLTTDLTVHIEGKEIPPGKHEWTLEFEPEGRWSIGEKPKDKGAAGRRHFLEVEDSSRKSPWLTAWFEPNPAAGQVTLHVGYGEQAGKLAIQVVEKVEAAAGGDVAIDRASLVSRVERLRGIAGAIESVGQVRHVWSAAFAEMGDALAAGGGTGWVESMKLVDDGESVSLTVKGRLPGDAKGAERLGVAMHDGELKRVLPEAVTPFVRDAKDGRGRTFQAVSQVSKEKWLPIEPVAALYDGPELPGIVSEVLLLDARISKHTKGSVANLSEVQSRLLAAKRDAGVIISGVEPGESVEGEEGVSSYSVKIVVAGPGAALVRFLRLVEGWDAALELRPLEFRQGDFGPELTVLVNFYSYVPLAEREPALYSALDKIGGGPGFKEKCELYLKGIDSWPVPPVRMPRWRRDPFAAPKKDEG